MDLHVTIKGHKSVTNEQNITGNNPNLDIINLNGYTIFGDLSSKFVGWG